MGRRTPRGAGPAEEEDRRPSAGAEAPSASCSRLRGTPAAPEEATWGAELFYFFDEPGVVKQNIYYSFHRSAYFEKEENKREKKRKREKVYLYLLITYCVSQK